MIIEPFKMRVTPEQHREVQRVIFDNGYDWYSPMGNKIVESNNMFLFFYQGEFDSNRNLTHSDLISTFNESTLPETTFEDFMAKYDKKKVRIEETYKTLVYKGNPYQLKYAHIVEIDNTFVGVGGSLIPKLLDEKTNIEKLESTYPAVNFDELELVTVKLTLE